MTTITPYAAIWIAQKRFGSERLISYFDLDRLPALTHLLLPGFFLQAINNGVAVFLNASDSGKEKSTQRIVLFSLAHGYGAVTRVANSGPFLSFFSAHSRAFFFSHGYDEAPCVVALPDDAQVPVTLPVTKSAAFPFVEARVLHEISSGFSFLPPPIGSNEHGPLIWYIDQLWAIL